MKTFLDSILSEYDSRLDVLNACMVSVIQIIRTILDTNAIEYHSVTGRVKDRKSLVRKVSAKPDKYSSINDVTDIVGIRVITYFNDEVDKVAEILKGEFDIDWANSVDKRASYPPDRVGYMSLHYIASLLPSRVQLTEYSAFQNLRFEIQIRSILQHAWAEIEHDRGYKSNDSLPSHLTHQFSCLAGLLEVGDNEFARLRDEIKKYKTEVSENLTVHPEAIEINELSIGLFIAESVAVNLVDADISQIVGISVSSDESIMGPAILFLLRSLHFCNYKNLLEITTDLHRHRKGILTYIRIRRDNLISVNSPGQIPRGWSIFYMCIYKLIQQGSVVDIIRFLNYVDHDDPEVRETRANEVVALRNDINAQLSIDH